MSIDEEAIIQWQRQKRKQMRWLRRLPWVSGSLTVIISVSALIGWLLDIPSFTLPCLQLTVVTSIVSFCCLFISPDNRTSVQRELEDML